jgi:hypothetical protein
MTLNVKSLINTGKLNFKANKMWKNKGRTSWFKLKVKTYFKRFKNATFQNIKQGKFSKIHKNTKLARK